VFHKASKTLGVVAVVTVSFAFAPSAMAQTIWPVNTPASTCFDGDTVKTRATLTPRVEMRDGAKKVGTIPKGATVTIENGYTCNSAYVTYKNEAGKKIKGWVKTRDLRYFTEEDCAALPGAEQDHCIEWVGDLMSRNFYSEWNTDIWPKEKCPVKKATALRAKPSPDGTKIMSIPKGATVRIGPGPYGDIKYFRVEYKGNIGWASAMYSVLDPWDCR